MYNYNQIRTVHLENTQKCQASCPMCDRNENGGVDNRWIDNSELSLTECKRIFTTDFIQQCALFQQIIHVFVHPGRNVDGEAT